MNMHDVNLYALNGCTLVSRFDVPKVFRSKRKKKTGKKKKKKKGVYV